MIRAAFLLTVFVVMFPMSLLALILAFGLSEPQSLRMDSPKQGTSKPKVGM